MIAYLLMALAFGISAVLLLLFVGRYAERGAKLANADETITDLSVRLEQAEVQQARLTSRIENLEAIVTGEAWEAFQQGNILQAPLPVEIPEEPSNEDKAAQMARRQRT
jgi:hypothetical protein